MKLRNVLFQLRQQAEHHPGDVQPATVGSSRFDLFKCRELAILIVGQMVDNNPIADGEFIWCADQLP